MSVEPAGGPSISVDARYLKRADVGISIYLADLIDDLIVAGARVTLLTDDEAHTATLGDRFPGATAQVLVGRSGMWWEQYTLARHLRQHRYDVHLAGANYGLPLLYRGPTVLALVVYDLIPLRFPRRYFLHRPLWAAKYLVSTLVSLARARRVIAISNTTARDVRRLRRHVPLTVRYPSAQPPPAAADLIVPPLPERFFLYHGGHDVRKNVPLMLDAYARHREVCTHPIDLVVLGNGWEAYEERFRSIGRAHVHRLGYVDEATKHAVIARATCVLYPSDFEGYGLPVVEALVHGIPVVSGTGGSLREVGGAAVIYADARSTDAFVEAMAVAISPAERERVRGAGPERVRHLTAAGRDVAILDALLPARRARVNR